MLNFLVRLHLIRSRASFQSRLVLGAVMHTGKVTPELLRLRHGKSSDPVQVASDLQSTDYEVSILFGNTLFGATSRTQTISAVILRDVLHKLTTKR